MIRTALLVLFGVLSVTAVDWNNLYVRWSSEDPNREKSFFKIPLTVDDAQKNGWVEVTGVNKLGLSIYCLKDDPLVCPVYQGNGCIGGLQLAQIAADVRNETLLKSRESQPMLTKATIFGTAVWHATYYTVDPDVISKSGRSCSDGLLGTDSVWLETETGYLKVPRKLQDLSSDWVKQSCLPTMGSHAFYKYSKSLACEDVSPWFLLHDADDLIGIGYLHYGSTSSPNREWYEPFPGPEIRDLAPAAPDCLKEWFSTYGTLLMHTFLIENPWNTPCPN